MCGILGNRTPLNHPPVISVVTKTPDVETEAKAEEVYLETEA